MSDVKRALAVSLLLSLGVGCGDPLVDQQRIVDTRVIGARVEVVAEPERATPTVGEDARLSLFVAGPDEAPPSVSFRLDVCSAEATTSGQTRCRETLTTATGAGDTPPEVTFTMPRSHAETRVAMVGIVCDSEVSAVNAAWPNWSCDSGKRTLVSYEISPGGEGASNQNPDASRDQLRIGDSVWVASEMSETCEGDVLLHVNADEEHIVRWQTAPENRETIEGGREGLLLTHLATAGELDRPFSAVQENENGGAGRAEVTWKAPKVSAGDTKVVSFHFVVRDERGGADWVQRRVCVDG